MSSILPLGRAYNFGRNANGGSVRVNLRDISGVGFVVDTPTAASTITVTEQNAASGGTSQNLNNGAASSIQFVYSQLNGVWTRQTTWAAAQIVTTAGSPDLVYVWIPQGALSDGFNYLSIVHSAKVGLYIFGDLDVQRTPANLRDVRA